MNSVSDDLRDCSLVPPPIQLDVKEHFIAQSGRFAMELQTQPNSYWHKSSLSLSLLILDCFSVVFILFNIQIVVVAK